MEFFRIPCLTDPSAVVEAIPGQCNETGMRKYPGGKHWHHRRKGESGTLEVTWANGELWAEMRSNREGIWCEAAAADLQRAAG